jgi:hypothetical protein
MLAELLSGWARIPLRANVHWICKKPSPGLKVKLSKVSESPIELAGYALLEKPNDPSRYRFKPGYVNLPRHFHTGTRRKC